ncbi:M23 family metallopeptidase [Radiobacillus kanasensis]|uniref:M23 family metallopeptidase n=1 Tax=Radiobacillus kanasensis TaxID=2844358 RepID=UPI001E45AABA|nr:M23 family metallopeptidase [Radiobacillus kanasensis]UFT97917.1 M23 family metallopeptidase [Radiobacillus kanasensis]
MRRDISEIRKDIAKRKRERTLSTTTYSSAKAFIPSVPQEEEKHGYLPFGDDSASAKGLNDKFVASFMIKTILAAVLFFGIAILYRVDLQWSDQPKQWASNALTEEFPFARVNQWYQERFGTPLAISGSQTTSGQASDQLALPVNGTVSQSFQTTGQGILITTDEESKVLAMKAGTVIFAGNDRQTNKTVILQHADGSNSIYGNLTSIDVHQYQSVQGKQEIGKFNPASSEAKEVYFAVEKENKFVDPVKVMQVDERP